MAHAGPGPRLYQRSAHGTRVSYHSPSMSPAAPEPRVNPAKEV